MDYDEIHRNMHRGISSRDMDRDIVNEAKRWAKADYIKSNDFTNRSVVWLICQIDYMDRKTRALHLYDQIINDPIGKKLNVKFPEYFDGDSWKNYEEYMGMGDDSDETTISKRDTKISNIRKVLNFMQKKAIQMLKTKRPH